MKEIKRFRYSGITPHHSASSSKCFEDTTGSLKLHDNSPSDRMSHPGRPESSTKQL
jgi:hypothetical protein